MYNFFYIKIKKEIKNPPNNQEKQKNPATKMSKNVKQWKIWKNLINLTLFKTSFLKKSENCKNYFFDKKIK